MKTMTQDAINLRNKWAEKDKKFFENLSPEELNVINSLAQALS